MFLSELSEGIEFDSEGYSKRCRSCRRKQARGLRIGCRAVCGPHTNEKDEDEEYDFLEEEEGRPHRSTSKWKRKQCRICRRKQARGLRIGCGSYCGPSTNEITETEIGKSCSRPSDCPSNKKCVRGECKRHGYDFDDEDEEYDFLEEEEEGRYCKNRVDCRGRRCVYGRCQYPHIMKRSGCRIISESMNCRGWPGVSGSR